MLSEGSAPGMRPAVRDSTLFTKCFCVSAPRVTDPLEEF